MSGQIPFEIRATNDNRPRDLPASLRTLSQHVSARSHLIRYVAFAALAIFVNLFWQVAVLRWVGGYWFSIYVAILFGNGAGLVFKYLVDKRWVYKDADQSLSGASRKFALYTAFGIGTTLLFWAVELAFHYVFDNALMTSIGAIIGLSIGYTLKYNLDKHFTFAPAKAKSVLGATAQR